MLRIVSNSSIQRIWKLCRIFAKSSFGYHKEVIVWEQHVSTVRMFRAFHKSKESGSHLTYR